MNSLQIKSVDHFHGYYCIVHEENFYDLKFLRNFGEFLESKFDGEFRVRYLFESCLILWFKDKNEKSLGKIKKAVKEWNKK